ncbi:hypothetical protein [Streptomyces sp. WG5]|uniref:hypothetical protein n=1 Tax=Streptomyces sp. WG5 TaxID=3417648 RepID=UPI003CF366DE
MAWQSTPGNARWYGEVVFEDGDGGTTYNYGYSASQEEPAPESLSVLLPKGVEAIEYKILPTPNNEAWEDWNSQQEGQ